MPTFPMVLQRLAELLYVQGVQFGSRPLGEVASVLSFLKAAGIDLDDQSAAAALAAIVLPPADARRFIAEGSLPPELVPDLKPSLIGIDDQLAKIVSNGSRPQAVVAASMLFALYRDAARRGDKTRTDSLRSWVDLIVESAANAGLKSVLISEIQRTEMQQPPVSPMRTNLLFSMSIDLVGSTDAKTRVRQLAKDNPERVDEFNTEIYKRFCNIEEAFYRSATSSYGAAKPIDLRRFFVVKGIGDEIWILCEAPIDDAELIGKRLIDSALQIAVRDVEFFATEHDDGGKFVPDFDYGAFEPVRSPIKVFLDTIEHASNVGRIRDDHLRRVIPEILERFHGSSAPAAEIAEVSNRLCLGRSEACAWSGLELYRTDYIGHEIDRFFRSTKAALPGTVVIGEAMAQRLGLRFNGPDDGILEVRNRSDVALQGGTPFDPIHGRSKTLTEKDMKGISYAYKTYVLFAPRALNAVYKTAAIQKEQGAPTPNYDETKKVLTTEVVQATAELYYPEQKDV